MSALVRKIRPGDHWGRSAGQNKFRTLVTWLIGEKFVSKIRPLLGVGRFSKDIILPCKILIPLFCFIGNSISRPKAMSDWFSVNAPLFGFQNESLSFIKYHE